MRLPCLIPVLAFFLGCATSYRPGGPPAPQGFLEKAYELALAGAAPSPTSRRDFLSVDNGNDTGITEIALERTECYGICSAYTVRLFADGHAEWKGRKYIKPIGNRIAALDLEMFVVLARLADDIGFDTLDDNYDLFITDSPTAFISIVKNDKRKIVRNYANSGPPRLWLFQEYLDVITSRLDWRKTDAQ